MEKENFMDFEKDQNIEFTREWPQTRKKLSIQLPYWQCQ